MRMYVSQVKTERGNKSIKVDKGRGDLRAVVDLKIYYFYGPGPFRLLNPGIMAVLSQIIFTN